MKSWFYKLINKGGEYIDWLNDTFPLFKWLHFQEENELGDELIADGDMELPQYGDDLVENGTFDPLYGPEELDESGAHGTATAANWVGSSATLSNPSAGVLRVTSTGAGGSARQVSTTIGKRYRLTLDALTDGVGGNDWRIRSGSTILQIGTNTSFESIVLEFMATGTDIRLESNDSSQTCDFRNISVVEVNPEWTLGDGWRIGSALEQLVDGDMEAAGVGDWTAVGGATLTKETGTPHGGTQVLRVADAGFARQTSLTIGKKYHVTGWVRGDGTSQGRVVVGSVTKFTATTSTVWQEVDFEHTQENDTTIELTLVGATFAEFDDFSILEVNIAHCDGAQVAVTDLTQDILVVGRTYDISWDVSNYQAGNVAALAGTAISALKSADGSYEERVTAVATTVGGVQGDATFLGDIDNVVIVEVITLTNWEVGSDAVLTKETTDPYEGLQNLRIARGGSSDPDVRQTNLIANKRYLVTGRARSDGTGIPNVWAGGAGFFWIGTTSTDWQEIDIEFETTSTAVAFVSRSVTIDGQYTEWDDVSVVELIPEGGGSVAYATNPERLFGRELCLNRNFTNWTGVAPNDAPDDWATTQVGDATSNVTQNPAGQCQIISDGTLTQISQDILEIGKTFTVTIDIKTVASGSIQVRLGSSGANATYNTTGIKTLSGTVAGNESLIIRRAVACDVTFDDITAKQTDIAKSGDFPGTELLSEAGSGVMDKDNYALTNITLINPSPEILRGTATANFGDARQTILTIGEQYKFTGEARSNGNTAGSLNLGGTQVLVSVTTSTDWQPYNLEAVATKDNARYTTNTSGEYIEWRNSSITPANPLNADYNGVFIGQLTGIDLGLAVLCDGINDDIDRMSAEDNSITDTENYHEMLWIQKDDWDNVERDFLSYVVDADNWIRITDTTTPGTIRWQHRAGGTTEEVTLITGEPITWLLVGISVKTVEGVTTMKAWYNEGQTGSDQIVAEELVGNFETMRYGSRDGTSNYHDGYISHAGSAPEEQVSSDIADMFNRGVS